MDPIKEIADIIQEDEDLILEWSVFGKLITALRNALGTAEKAAESPDQYIAALAEEANVDLDQLKNLSREDQLEIVSSALQAHIDAAHKVQEEAQNRLLEKLGLATDEDEELDDIMRELEGGEITEGIMDRVRNWIGGEPEPEPEPEPEQPRSFWDELAKIEGNAEVIRKIHQSLDDERSWGELTVPRWFSLFVKYDPTVRRNVLRILPKIAPERRQNFMNRLILKYDEGKVKEFVARQLVMEIMRSQQEDTE
jgi:hypothetical protein